MSHRTKVLCDYIGNHLSGGPSWPMPSQLQIGLFIEVYDYDEGVVVEPTPLYQRQDLVLGAPVDDGLVQVSQNVDSVEFPENLTSGNLGEVVAFGIYADGELFYIKDLIEPIVYTPHLRPIFSPGTLSVGVVGTTDYLANLYLNHLRGDTPWPQPPSMNLRALTSIVDSRAGDVVAYGSAPLSLDFDGECLLSSDSISSFAINVQQDETIVGVGLDDGSSLTHVFHTTNFELYIGATLEYRSGDVSLILK